ncbi:MAG: sugar phosphate isomerase/epimerase [Planctomycetota bacterium]|nr:sugar phosphate isomerase/epimerase [Planctomycetota bacterium]
MHPQSTHRRQFLQQAMGAAATAPFFLAGTMARSQETPLVTAGTKPVRLGGPVFQAPQDPDELAASHRQLGYRAAYCPAVGLNDTDRIRDVVRAFAKHDVAIAEVGRWCNLLDADSAKRAANLKTVSDGLALAEALGARCCVDIAGSFSREAWHGPHPENLSEKYFDETVENARKIIDAVKPQRAKFCFEMMGWALPDSPDSYVRLIKAVDRPAFGVHLDPCNLVNCPARFYQNGKLIDECFDKLAPWIASCHAKDVTWDVEMQIHFREVTIGTGSLDFTTYLRRLAALPGDVPLMIEHMANAAEYDKCRQHLFELGKRSGVGFA